jgi:hypothetical protein
MLTKDCFICVYDDVCLERKLLKTATDCCVPEESLRKLQRQAFATQGVEGFIKATKDYVARVKSRSTYWLDKKSHE